MDSRLPEKLALQHTYLSYCDTFAAILSLVEERLKKTVRLQSAPTYKSRIKSFESYYKKILRKKPGEVSCQSLVPLTDMMGIRVICAFLEDIDVVEKQVTAEFAVVEVERKGNEQTVKEFGYESVHILVQVPPDCVPAGTKPLPEGTVVEIQIRTILQDAWAEVEHELVYKSEFNPFDKPLRRKLASINASLSLADIIFQEIRDYQKKLQNELDFRRNTFYEKADDMTGSCEKAELGQPPESIVDTSPYTKGTIDDLVLEALHAHNVGDLTRAVGIYSQILAVTPPPPPVVLSVIHKHRGMAYFAQNRYDDALADFTQSIALDPDNFRSYYYAGIVYSVLGREEEAVACFDTSIQKSAFHSHVYYRRALSHYNLGDYNASLADLTAANNLGLDNEDCHLLRSKLLKKFDMGM